MSMDDALTKHLEHHEMLLDYHLANYETAKTKGALGSAEQSLATSAQHAAIVAALRLRNSEDPNQ